MEWLTLLILGSLAAGIGLWSARGSGKEERPYSSKSAAEPPEQPIPRGRRASDPVRIGEEEPETFEEPVEAPKPQEIQDRKKKGEEQKAPDREFPEELPNSTDDIIPRGSPHSHHRRALQTAETLAEKGKFKEASELYERIKNRISDPDIRKKIQENIDALKGWDEEGKPEKKSGPSPFSMGAEQLAMEQLAEGLRSVSEGLVGQLLYGLPNAFGSAPPPMDSIRQQVMEELDAAGPGARVGPDWQDSSGAGGLPEGISVNEDGNLETDGWSDEDFEKEWEKYKNLPLRDRRTGGDRRDEEGDEIDPRRDRRDGDDRRKNDLFRERDEFLQKLEKHKRNKRLLDELESKKDAEDSLREIAPASQNLSITAIENMDEEAILIQASSMAELRPGPLMDEQEPEGEAKPGEEPKHGEEPKPGEGPKPGGEAKPEEGQEPERSALAVPAPHVADMEPIRLPEAMSEKVEEEEEETPIYPDELPGAPSFGSPDAVESEEGGIPEIGEGGGGEEGEPETQVQEIRGVLELKPPDEEDTPYLSLTYDFTRIPDSFKLSADYHTMEYAYYKYKPMLIKAQEFTRRKMLKNALNYYRVIKSQNIPPEFKRMINRNIQDITEYLEKFLMGR